MSQANTKRSRANAGSGHAHEADHTQAGKAQAGHERTTADHTQAGHAHKAASHKHEVAGNAHAGHAHAGHTHEHTDSAHDEAGHTSVLNESGPLARFSVAMPEALLMRFDRLVARRGVAKNRSELVRDLVREALIREEADEPGAEVMGTLTIVYGHHSSDIQETLHRIQHAHFGMIISTTHVHLDEDNCLEVIILRGEATEVRAVSDQILGTKGVKNGDLVITTTGQMI